jgi:hypothetical protein
MDRITQTCVILIVAITLALMLSHYYSASKRCPENYVPVHKYLRYEKMYKRPEVGPIKYDESCVDTCADKFEDCLQACENIDGGNSCDTICEINGTVCNHDCYAPIFTIRNGSVYTLYLYDYESLQLLGTLDGWSPDKITIVKFPILVTDCDPTNVTKSCGDSSVQGMVITDPGCYIVWYFYGYYTTDEVCYTK